MLAQVAARPSTGDGWVNLQHGDQVQIGDRSMRFNAIAWAGQEPLLIVELPEDTMDWRMWAAEQRAAAVRMIDEHLRQTREVLNQYGGNGVPVADGPWEIRIPAYTPDDRYCVLSLDVQTGEWQTIIGPVTKITEARQILRPRAAEMMTVPNNSGILWL